MSSEHLCHFLDSLFGQSICMGMESSTVVWGDSKYFQNFLHESTNKLGSAVTDNHFGESMGREDSSEENLCSVLCSY